MVSSMISRTLIILVILVRLVILVPLEQLLHSVVDMRYTIVEFCQFS